MRAACTCWVVVVGCTSTEPYDGTLAYLEAGTQSLRVLDLASGASQLIDNGRFATVSIAPDGQHVAYEGQDMVMKVADLAGDVTALESGGCLDSGRWSAPEVMSYCISDAGSREGSMVLASLDGSPARFVASYSLAVSPDATLDAYVDLRGNVILERIDGSESHVLVPSTDPTAMYPHVYVERFTADQRAVIVADQSPVGLRVVSLEDGATVTPFAGLRPFSGVFGPTAFLGASSSSADDREALFEAENAIVAVELATGAIRTIVTLPARTTCAGAVFLDRDHVLWVREDDQSQGDLGRVESSVHVAGPGGEDRVLLAPTVANATFSTIAVFSGVIALASDQVHLLRSDGAQVATVALGPSTPVIVGATADGRGIVVTGGDGVVRMVGPDGATTDLATAAGTGFASVAYAP